MNDRTGISSRLLQPTARAALAPIASFMPFIEEQKKQEV
jgi:hypothetical protein